MMSKCGFCQARRWEVNTEEPTGSKFRLIFVRCAACKVPVGVMEFFNSGAKLEKVEKALKNAGLLH